MFLFRVSTNTENQYFTGNATPRSDSYCPRISLDERTMRTLWKVLKTRQLWSGMWYVNNQDVKQFRNASDVILSIIPVSQAGTNSTTRHDFFISIIFFLMPPLWFSYVDRWLLPIPTPATLSLRQTILCFCSTFIKTTKHFCLMTLFSVVIYAVVVCGYQ